MPIYAPPFGSLQRANKLLSIQKVVGIYLALHIGQYIKDAETIGWATNDATYRWASRCDDDGAPLTLKGLEKFVAEYVREVEEPSSASDDLGALWIAHAQAARLVSELAELIGTSN